MSIGKQISNIRKEHDLTQEEFGKLFFVTRQTVSNWENEKSYPDLQTLVSMSDRFGVSLDVMLKGDKKMVETIDRERMTNSMKREKQIIDFFTGGGTGLLMSCLMVPDSVRRTITACIGVGMIWFGWYRKARYDKRIMEYINRQ
ncbi:MAG: helix-turn-helix transcriptional regulator [Anaerotignum sp.]|nr:helix-turn-helix transcriptional regulator [Anaerotignum sp.]